MTDTFACPQCGILLRRSPAMSPGVLVKCPKCTQTFRVPDPALPAAPPLPLAPAPAPSTNPFAFEEVPAGRPPARGGESAFAFDEEPHSPRLPAPGDDDRPIRRRFRDLDEDEDDRPRRVSRLEKLSPDYEVDIGGWFSLGFNHFGAVAGPAAGALLLMFITLIPVAGLLSLIPLIGPLVTHLFLFCFMQGFTIVALAEVQGKRWGFGDFFSGFNWMGPLLGLFFFEAILALVSMAPVVVGYVVGLVALFNAGGPGGGVPFPFPFLALIGGAYFVGLVCFLALFTRLCTFAVPLIVTRRYGPIEAMQGSWRLSQGHFWGLLGFNVLLFLTAMSGAVVCVGYLFTYPLSHLILAAAFVRIMNLPCNEGRRSRHDFDDEEDRPRRRLGRQRSSTDDDY